MNFIKFLTKNKAYRQFMHNLAYVPDHTWAWNDYKEWNDPEDYIANAFYWELSPEKNKFWYGLHNKWINSM